MINRNAVIAIFLLFVSHVLASPPKFAEFFVDSTLRIDYNQTGNADEDYITIDQIYKQGIWAGNPHHLIDPFNNGKYFIKIYDVASNQLIFSRGFNSYFGEYQTTNPAIDGQMKTYHESALIPCPKDPVNFVLEKRDRNNILFPLFTCRIDPDDYHIIT